ncbi:MAG: hypothetical protein IKA36_03535 [Clostridia bacterium]|nr:hypothetical protein [Clostridia bacterium]
MDILKVERILFLGIGGVSMHQLALFMNRNGAKVFGYDASNNDYVKKLKSEGVEVSKRFNLDFLPIDLCVCSPAIKEDNKYIEYCKTNKIKVMDRIDFLNELSSHFKSVIAVAGTHGKSTTASLIYEILRVAGKKVSCHIGADVFAPRFSLGDDYLVLEACEYNKSFLKINPTISVVTNVEAEHMDSYKNMFSLHTAFSTFMKRGMKRYTFRENSTRFLSRVKDVVFVDKTKYNIMPKIKGEYNLKNISLAIKVCEDLGVEGKDIINAVNNFSGIPRRYELIGRMGEKKVYIDYAHHPTELRSFLALYNSEHKNCLIVFQPHTYSRTKRFLKEFVDILKHQKNLCIYKEYPAREKSTQGISSKQLYELVKKENPNVFYSASRRKIEKRINEYSSIAFVGAGDINKIAVQIVENYKISNTKQ